MKKIILSIMCVLFCSISINAETFKYKSKNNTSPIKEYKVKYRWSEGVGILSFSLEGKLIDKEGNPLTNKSIKFHINYSLLLLNSDNRDKDGNELIIQTNSNGFFSKTFEFNGPIPDYLYRLKNRKEAAKTSFECIEIAFVFCNWEIEKYKLINGQNMYSVPNPVRIIYKYPFDKFIKIIPYDKNDNAQLKEIEDSKSNVIVLDTIDLSAEYFRKKQNIIAEAKNMLKQEEIYDDVEKLIIEADGSIKNNWKEIINSKIKEVNEERKRKEEERKRKEQKRQDEIEAFKHDPDVHAVQSQITRCPQCYRLSLIVSIWMKTGDPYHQGILYACKKCGYIEQKFNGF